VKDDPLDYEIDPEVKDVFREESSRSKRHIEPALERENQRKRRNLVKVFKEGNERKYLEAIRHVGLKDGTPPFERALLVFRRYHKL
jgi:hypothetical protein